MFQDRDKHLALLACWYMSLVALGYLLFYAPSLVRCGP